MTQADVTRQGRPLYSAIFLSGDLGTRVNVTKGHRNVEEAKAEVAEWCRREGEERLAGGEVLVCRARDRESNRSLRVVARWIDGRWQTHQTLAEGMNTPRDAPHVRVAEF